MTARLSARDTLLALLPHLLAESPAVPMASLAHSLMTRFIFLPSSSPPNSLYSYTQPPPDLRVLSSLPVDDLVCADVSVGYRVRDAETAAARVPLGDFWAVFLLEGEAPGEWKWFDVIPRGDDEEEDDWEVSLELAVDKFHAQNSAEVQDETDARVYWGPSDEEDVNVSDPLDTARNSPHRTHTELDRLANARIGVDDTQNVSAGRTGDTISHSAPMVCSSSSTDATKASDTNDSFVNAKLSNDDVQDTVPTPSMPIPIPIPASMAKTDANYTPSSTTTDNSDRRGKFIRRDLDKSDIHKPPIITSDQDAEAAQMLHLERPLRIVKRASTDIIRPNSPPREFEQDFGRFSDNDIAAINAVQGVYRLWLGALDNGTEAERTTFFRIVQAAMQS